MKRIALTPRPDWRMKVEDLGLVWHTTGETPYWCESAAYVLTSKEADVLQSAAQTLYALFLEAGEHIIARRLLHRFGVPEALWPLVEDAWRREPPALNHGRFDLGYDADGPPKLFEFNCDTPTALLETAVVQWAWKAEVFPDLGQCNALHDALVEKWRDLAACLPAGAPVFFAHADDPTGEESVTSAYLRDAAREAGLAGRSLLMRDIGWNGRGFAAPDGTPIRTLHKLYPWEWMAAEPFAAHLPAADTVFIEPIWKMIWSNKMILSVLWELFPDHPNLLWASHEGPLAASYVRKPCLGREGANLTLVRRGDVLAATEGEYDGPAVWQGLYDLPDFDGARPVVGAWIVDGTPAGLCIREDGLITSNTARFVPHVVDDGPEGAPRGRAL